MVAQLPVPGVARVTVKGTAGGIPIQNVFHVQKTSTPGVPFTDAMLDAIATQMGTTWDNYVAGSLNTSYVAGSTEAIDLGQDISHVGNRPNTGNGISSGSHVPQSACCVISWKITRHYKGGHPRTYIGPLGDNAITSQTSLAPGFLVTLGVAALHIHDDTNGSSPGGATVRLAVVHRYRDGAKLDPPQVSPIVGWAFDTRIDSQRRRLGPDR